MSSFTFDNTIPQERRAARILEMVKNPYCFRAGDMGVKLELSDNAPTLQEVLTSFSKCKKAFYDLNHRVPHKAVRLCGERKGSEANDMEFATTRPEVPG